MTPPRSILALMLLWAAAICGCGGPVTLHAPTCAPSAARVQPAKLDLEPIVMRGTAAASSTVELAHPEPAEVLTSGMRSELAARALSGGEAGGYRVRCTLDRFAIRASVGFAGTSATAMLYVDLGCTVERLADRADVWRGALRGRAIARGSAPFASQSSIVQRLVDRAMSDAARELASDLAVRVLALGGAPSARVFPDEAARARIAGIDDSTFGPVALAEAPDRVPPLLPSTRDREATTRAAAWNAIAMSTGPGDPWYAGGVSSDDDPLVRFYQYKALARHASASSLALLRQVLMHEVDPLLLEFGDDALATGGLGLNRRSPGG